MDISRAKDILDYWIPGDGTADYDKWFMNGPEYDEEIKEKFGDLLQEAEQGMGFGWLHTKESFVAYIILLDQFSRHIYRGTGESFKNDSGVMIFTDLGFDLYREQLIGYEFMFAYMPYMHTENSRYQKKGELLFREHNRLYYQFSTPQETRRVLTDQKKCDFMGSTLDLDQTRYDKENNMLKSMAPHVEGHQLVILRYGRFPKRNEALGRKSTPSEIKYMETPEVQKRAY